jgi:hypothetical protein
MGLQIDVSGNLTPITKSLEDLKSDLKAFKSELDRSTDPVRVAQLNKELKATEDEIKRIRSIGPIIPQSAVKGANEAAAALTDVGRVAQDLPFGFVGVQNNLNPLLESFRRLKAETGSGVAAIKALAGQLIGAGGLGLALSVVSAAILIYQNGIAGFTSKTKQAKDEATKLVELLNSIQSAMDVAFQGEGASQAQIIQITALSAAVQDVTRSETERTRALDKLKSINKEYFGDLKLEEDSLRTLNPLIQEYTNAIIQQAIVRELSSEIGKLGAVYVKQKEAVRVAREELNKYKESLGIDEVDKAGKRTFVLDNNIDKLNINLREAQKTLAPTTAKYNELAEALRNATIEGLKFRDTKTPGKEEDLLKKRLDALEAIKKLTKDPGVLVGIQEAIFELQVKIAVRDKSKLISKEEMAALIKGYRDQLNEAFLNQAIALEAIPKLRFSEVSRIDIPKQITDVISKATGNEKITITLHDVRVRFLGGKKTAQIEGIEKVNKELVKQISDATQTLKADVAETIGNALGEALASGDFSEGLKNGAKALLNVLGTFMQQIGRYIITAALQIQLLKKTLEQFAISNPALAIAGGIALIAAGAALKNAVFQGPKFATGAIVTGPTIGMVGEAGPEVIMPLRRLPDMLGNKGSSQPIVLSAGLKIDGRSLIAFLQQETTAFKRIF